MSDITKKYEFPLSDLIKKVDGEIDSLDPEVSGEDDEVMDWEMVKGHLEMAYNRITDIKESRLKLK